MVHLQKWKHARKVKKWYEIANTDHSYAICFFDIKLIPQANQYKPNQCGSFVEVFLNETGSCIANLTASPQCCYLEVFSHWDVAVGDDFLLRHWLSKPGCGERDHLYQNGKKFRWVISVFWYWTDGPTEKRMEQLGWHKHPCDIISGQVRGGSSTTCYPQKYSMLHVTKYNLQVWHAFKLVVQSSCNFSCRKVKKKARLKL